MAIKKRTTKKRATKPSKQTPSSPQPASAGPEMAEGDPQKKPFTPKVLDRTAIAIPLLEKLIAEDEAIKRARDVYAQALRRHHRHAPRVSRVDETKRANA